MSKTPYCPTCKEPFQSQGLFDDHRVGPYNPSGLRRCLTPEEMTAKGWRRDKTTWRGPAPSQDQLEALRARGMRQ